MTSTFRTAFVVGLVALASIDGAYAVAPRESSGSAQSKLEQVSNPRVGTGGSLGLPPDTNYDNAILTRRILELDCYLNGGRCPHSIVLLTAQNIAADQSRPDTSAPDAKAASQQSDPGRRSGSSGKSQAPVRKSENPAKREVLAQPDGVSNDATGSTTQGTGQDKSKPQNAAHPGAAPHPTASQPVACACDGYSGLIRGVCHQLCPEHGDFGYLPVGVLVFLAVFVSIFGGWTLYKRLSEREEPTESAFSTDRPREFAGQRDQSESYASPGRAAPQGQAPHYGNLDRNSEHQDPRYSLERGSSGLPAPSNQSADPATGEPARPAPALRRGSTLQDSSTSQPASLYQGTQRQGPPPSLGSIQSSPAELQELIENLSNRLSQSERTTRERTGSAEELAALEVLIRPSPVRGNVAGVGGQPRVEELLLSAASFYLAGMCQKTDLPSMLSELNVSCRLVLHQNIERFLADPGATRVDFATSDQDGCWLWHDQAGGRSLAVPIDVNVFRIPPAPILLGRLCEGVTQGMELRILAAIRPCSFQREANSETFKLVSKGEIRTAGGVTLPSSQQVRDFATLRAQIRPTPAFGSASLASILKLHIDFMRERLLGFERALQASNYHAEQIEKLDSLQKAFDARLRTLERKAETPVLVVPATPGGQGQQNPIVFNAVLKGIKEKQVQIHALEASVRILTERLDRLTNQATVDVSPADPPVSVEAAKEPADRAEIVAPRPEPLIGPGRHSTDSNNPVTVDDSEMMPERALVPPSETSLLSTPASRVTSQRDSESSFPVGWQQVLAKCPDLASPDPASQTSALLGLVNLLQRSAGPSCTINLVHVIEAQRQMRVHFADVAHGQIQCHCGVSKPFFFAVCAGDKGSQRLQVVLPAGRYSGSNYPAGYSALIFGFEGDPFTIQTVEAAAVLQRVPDGGPDEYVVAQQMHIT